MIGETLILGIDVGGTSIKAGLVDILHGQLVSERCEVNTPKPSRVADLTEAVLKLVAPFQGQYALAGIGFPASVRRGIVLSAVNIHRSWIEADLGRIFGDLLGVPVWGLNDSDAAATAEAVFGAGQDVDGTVVVVTLGTGVGTTLVIDRHLVPNIELGLLSVRGKRAGERVSNRARRELGLSWANWAADLDRFVHKLERAVSPDLIVIGGGVSEQAERFLPLLTARTPVVAAQLRNDGGIVGAALYAWDQVERRRLFGERPPQVISLSPPSGSDAG
ncbi:MAG: ROK family protein [Chloroflexi bacterium]|nr:ROK family protein [Chloroflexota bacterium]